MYFTASIIILSTFTTLVKTVFPMVSAMSTGTISTADDRLWRPLDIPTCPNPGEQPWHTGNCRSHQVVWHVERGPCEDGCKNIIRHKIGFLACKNCYKIKPGSTRQINICMEHCYLKLPISNMSSEIIAKHAPGCVPQLISKDGKGNCENCYQEMGTKFSYWGCKTEGCSYYVPESCEKLKYCGSCHEN
ncbi:hypothetical protein PGT21_022292 [Puccinia graminis f. sp. tritici]|uniref:Uncharacterized protein n=1 Tax=Puccinia graminis f. sp. tritici TaxID=56615 RepID=A0A5B0RL55_PUCGR|nr:hypothetical protein PGT21_022292 [Puccinia graminis f. sp. tritici]KAA1125444.1 hypothetical protein PGTUg99_015010 [Puccinia graminis f. sp. tritici]